MHLLHCEEVPMMGLATKGDLRKESDLLLDLIRYVERRGFTGDDYRAGLSISDVNKRLKELEAWKREHDAFQAESSRVIDESIASSKALRPEFV